MDVENIWTFSKKDTKALKGVAALCMVAHHVWAFPGRLPVGDLSFIAPKLPFTVNDSNVFTSLGMFSKICVVLFMFIAGYGLYLHVSSCKYRLWERIKRFYLSFWKVFFIMVPIAFLFFSSQEQLTDPANSVSYYQRYLEFDLNTFIMNLFGLSTSYNDEWWFVFGYVCSCIFGYLYLCFSRKCNNLNAIIYILNCLL